MIHIPIGETSVCTATSAATKVATCEKCRQRYSYVAVREAKGAGLNFLCLAQREADEQARVEAERALQYELARAIAPVPCPRCGWFQANMLPIARQRHLKVVLDWPRIEHLFNPVPIGELGGR
jgi:hypothetical protein